MASKLEKHTRLIEKRFASGQTLSAIANRLSSLGVQTTPQNLGSWIKRRQARIQERQKLLETPPITKRKPN